MRRLRPKPRYLSLGDRLRAMDSHYLMTGRRIDRSG